MSATFTSGLSAGVDAMYGHGFSTSPAAGFASGGSGATLVAGFGTNVGGALIVETTVRVWVTSVGAGVLAEVHAVSAPTTASRAITADDRLRLIRRA
ncbi:MAG: hypothetical protein ABI232_05860 [Jatrophihabitantaceae bacterium]